MMQNKSLLVTLSILLVAILFIQISPIFAASPSGATVTPGTPETAPSDSAGSALAQAGNVTELNINGYTTTQSWQGYYGNVTGTIQLADADDDIFYNWTLADPQGEVYASTNNSITWLDIQCFNFTASGAFGDESGNGGTTNLQGVNLTNLETRFNIASDDVDGVNETFTFQDHDEFFTANQQFSADECISTRVYGDSGPVDQEFEEVLLYEPNTGSVVFAALLEESSVLGYNSGDNDFQLLVLEDGHGTDTDATTYYFFVEIE